MAKKLLDLFLVLFLVGVLLPGAATAQETTEEDVFVDAVHERLASGEYQTQLPEDPEIPTIDPNSSSWWFLGAFGVFFTILFWTIFGLTVLFILYQIIMYFSDKAKVPTNPKEVVRPEALKIPKAPAPLPSLADVDALAKEGHFEEAIHFLLLIIIERLFKMLKKAQPKSRTSREILRDPALVKTWKENLGVLVDAVESSLFAGNKVTAAEYKACRKRFEALAGAVKDIKS